MLSGITSTSTMLAELFKTLDSDGSSGVSATELTEATGGVTGSSSSMEDIFAALDSDGDGTISQLEFTSAFEQLEPAGMSVVLEAQESQSSLVDSLLNALDSDGDGSVTEEEFTTYLEEHTESSSGASSSVAESLFADLDINDDGAVDEAELTSYLSNATAVMTEIETGAQRQAEAAAKGAPPPAGGTSESFDPLDTNKDGMVSAAELAAASIGIAG